MLNVKNISHFIVDFANGKSHYWNKLVEGITCLVQRIKPKCHHADSLIHILLFMVVCSYLYFILVTVYHARGVYIQTAPWNYTLLVNSEVQLLRSADFWITSELMALYDEITNLELLWNFMNRDKRLNTWWKKMYIFSLTSFRESKPLKAFF